jgi:beta-lactamase class A
MRILSKRPRHSSKLLLSVAAAAVGVLLTTERGHAQPAADPAAVASRCSGSLRAYARNLQTGAEFGFKADERARTASTIKVAIMAAVFTFVQRGEASWSEEIPLLEIDRTGGSGVVRELSANVRLPLRDLVNLMIVVSDNTATNMILERFTADAINDEIARMGFKETKVLRRAVGGGSNPSQRGTSRERDLEKIYGMGVTTPREVVRLLGAMNAGRLVSPEASRAMLDIMRREQDRTGIGRRDTTPSATKYGSLERTRNDVGIVYAKGGPVAMAIMVDELPVPAGGPDNPGSLCIADLSESLVATLGGQR